MASQTDVINLALYKLGQSDTIPDMTDQSKAAVVGARAWAQAVGLVLCDRVWDWALKAEALALSPDAPTPGWGYSYAYPNDCLRLWAVVDAPTLQSNPYPAYWCGYEWPDHLRHLYAWRKGWGSQSTSVEANIPQAMGIFVVNMDAADTERFPPHFVEALACKLAQIMAAPMIGDIGLNAQTTLRQAYQLALSEASAFDGNESRVHDEPTPALLARA